MPKRVWVSEVVGDGDNKKVTWSTIPTKVDHPEKLTEEAFEKMTLAAKTRADNLETQREKFPHWHHGPDMPSRPDQKPIATKYKKEGKAHSFGNSLADIRRPNTCSLIHI